MPNGKYLPVLGAVKLFPKQVTKVTVVTVDETVPEVDEDALQLGNVLVVVVGFEKDNLEFEIVAFDVLLFDFGDFIDLL